MLVNLRNQIEQFKQQKILIWKIMKRKLGNIIILEFNETVGLTKPKSSIQWQKIYQKNYGKYAQG